MKAIGVLALAGVGVLVGGAAVWAYEKREGDSPDDILDLPQPPETECVSGDEVWNSTQDVLAGTHTSAELKAAATVLRNWELDGNQFCDDNARVMAQTCAGLLDARAATVQNVPRGGTPPDAPLRLPPIPFPFPGSTYYSGFGYCPEGATLDMASGMCEMPLPSRTSGACCAACERGEDCEGCA